MKITIALGNAADTGGPTKYALNLRTQWEALGHEVRLVSYAPWMWRLPSGVRHLCYTVSLMSAARTADIFVGFDTMTVGAPLALASKLSRVPYIIRIGGDFVWEQYVERTGNLVKLSRFYTEARAKWSGKERLEVWLTGLVARNAAAMMFNSAWQKNMWCRVYGISAASACVVENYFPTRSEGLPPVQKNFVAAGRAIKLKQEDMLKRVFARIRPTPRARCGLLCGGAGFYQRCVAQRHHRRGQIWQTVCMHQRHRHQRQAPGDWVVCRHLR
jgi:hypothetical protein